MRSYHFLSACFFAPDSTDTPFRSFHAAFRAGLRNKSSKASLRIMSSRRSEDERENSNVVFLPELLGGSSNVVGRLRADCAGALEAE